MVYTKPVLPPQQCMPSSMTCSAKLVESARWDFMFGRSGAPDQNALKHAAGHSTDMELDKYVKDAFDLANNQQLMNRFNDPTNFGNGGLHTPVLNVL